MADSSSSATVEVPQATTAANSPIQDLQNVPEPEVEKSSRIEQQTIRAIGDSPETPPSRFAKALEQLPSSSAQTGMLRQLQRSYGNSYVGEVIQQREKSLHSSTTVDSSHRPSQSPRSTENAPTEITTPIDLKGQTDFNSDAVAAFLITAPKKTGKIPVQFGTLAAGSLVIRRTESKDGAKYNANKQPLNLLHPFFQNFATVGLTPKLFLGINNNKIEGRIDLAERGNLTEQLQKVPQSLGLTGFDLSKLSKSTLKNEVAAGKLRFGVENIEVTLGEVFSGNLTLLLEDETIKDFKSTMTLAEKTIKGSAGGTLALMRSPEGVITGSIDLDITLARFTGKLKGQWDGQTFTADGSIAYSGEKLSGNINFHVMEKQQADQMLQERQTPPEVTAAKSPPSTKPTTTQRKKEKPNYVVAGEGTLNYIFTDWLHGSAQVIADYKGYITVIGKIVPQAQIQLFKPPPFRKDFPEFKARATYGLPVIANIFIEAGVGLTLWATIEGNLKDIQVDGEYSTDPTKRNKFSLTGTINISAAAGITLHGFIDAGLEILDHEIKIGAGINGTLGIKGYINGKPTIGYREEGTEGEDKKGVFFIQGEIEIAAQPFLGLSGELYVKLDSPWWSPAPDKTWPWHLGDKEWPLGGSFGIGADVNYVFGSGQAPTVSFKEAEFDGDNFLASIIDDRLDSGKGGEIEQQGQWKEKNTPQAAPPTAPPAPTAGVQSGTPSKKSVKAPPIPSTSKKKGSKPPPEFDPTGKTPEETESRLVRQEEQKKAAEQQIQQKGPKKGDGKVAQEQADKQLEEQKSDPTQKWQRGVAAVEQALAYAQKTGIELGELNKVLKSIRRHGKYGFTKLYAENGGEQWIVFGNMSPEKQITTVPKLSTSNGELLPNNNVRNLVFKLPVPKKRHLTHYKDLAKTGQLINDPNYKRKADQQSKWLNEIPVDRELRRAWQQEQNLASLQESVIPTWNRFGAPVPFEVDHIHELQVGGEDVLENYELLDAPSNISAGPTIQNFINAERQRLRTIHGVEPNWLIFDADVIVQGGQGSGEYWTKQEIESGEHIDVIRKHNR